MAGGEALHFAEDLTGAPGGSRDVPRGSGVLGVVQVRLGVLVDAVFLVLLGVLHTVGRRFFEVLVFLADVVGMDVERPVEGADGGEKAFLETDEDEVSSSLPAFAPRGAQEISVFGEELGEA